MDKKSNEELALMIRNGESVNSAFEQLAIQLKGMMFQIGKKHLRSVPMYDDDDIFQEGCITLWNLFIRDYYKGYGKIGCLFYTAFENHCSNLYRDYVMKNMIQLGEPVEDLYNYGYNIVTLVEADFALEYREKQKIYNKRWREKKYGPAEPKKPKLTSEEKAEKARERSREYYEIHKEEMKQKKREWYMANREYALKYQKAYAKGVRIGKHDPPKK